MSSPPLSPATIFLVRHGAVHNPAGIYYGRLPRFRLSAAGRRQATLAGAQLRAWPVAQVISSSLLRARQTAYHLAAAAGVAAPIRCSRLWSEVYTPYDGRLQVDLAARQWDLYSDAPAGYETPADVLARALVGLARLRRRYAGQVVVVVTHADLIAFTMVWALGQPLVLSTRQQLRRFGLADDYPDHASLTRLDFTAGAARPTLTYTPLPTT